MSQQLIAKIEVGQVTETRKITRIARAFGMTVEQFYSRAGLKQEGGKPSPPDPAWPFGTFSRERFERLPPEAKLRVEGAVLMLILEAESSQGVQNTDYKSRRAVNHHGRY